MKSVAIVNKKGGVGKTTTAVNMAAALAEMGKRILLMDLDGQRNSTAWCLGLSTSNPDTDILDAVLDGSDALRLVVDSNIPGVQVIPASTSLQDAEARITKITQVQLLRKTMSTWPDVWDYVILDCPPDMKSLTIAALLAATDVIIVSQPGTMDITGIEAVVNDIKDLQTDLNPNLGISGILLTRTDPRTLATRGAIDVIREAFPGFLYNTTIRNNVRFLEAHGWSKAILQYAPTSTGAEDYRAFAREFIERNGGGK